MTPDEQQMLLERLAGALQRGLVMVELVNRLPGQPEQRVAKEGPAAPAITARVRDYHANDGLWLCWWFWWQPIGSIRDLERVVNSFCGVVLAVAGER